jgi:hypothetical protein
MDIVVTLPPNIINGIKQQIIGELKAGDLFAPAPVKPLLTADDYREIASRIDVSAIAAEFDAHDIADEVNTNAIGEIVADNMDAADVAQHLINAGIDWSECVDHDKIAAAIVRSFKQDPELRDALMVSLCRMITGYLSRA